MRKAKIIFVTYKNEEEPIMTQGILKCIIENKYKNAMIINFDFSDMSEEAIYHYLDTVLDKTFDNHIVFFPSAKFFLKMTEESFAGMFWAHNIASLSYFSIDSIRRRSVFLEMSTANYLDRFKIFDTVYHYDPQEAKKFGLTYYPLILDKIEHCQKASKEPKVFFCGRAKGRQEELQRVSNFLEKNNIEYDFLLFGKPPKSESARKKYRKIQFISDFIPYREMVKRA